MKNAKELAAQNLRIAIDARQAYVKKCRDEGNGVVMSIDHSLCNAVVAARGEFLECGGTVDEANEILGFDW